MATNVPVFVQHGRTSYLAYLLHKNEAKETATIRWEWDTIGKPDIVPLSSVQFISDERARRHHHLPGCTKENNQSQTQPKHDLIDDAAVVMSKNNRATRSRGKVPTKKENLATVKSKKKCIKSCSVNNSRRGMKKQVKHHRGEAIKDNVSNKKRITRSKSRALKEKDSNGDENLTSPSSVKKATVVSAATNDSPDDNIAIKKQIKRRDNVSNKKRNTRSKSSTLNELDGNEDENLTSPSSANKDTVVCTVTNDSPDDSFVIKKQKMCHGDMAIERNDVSNKKRITRSKSRTLKEKEGNGDENLISPSSVNKATMVCASTNDSLNDKIATKKQIKSHGDEGIEDNASNKKRISWSKSRALNKIDVNEDENLTSPSSANKDTVVCTAKNNSLHDNMSKDESMSEDNVLNKKRITRSRSRALNIMNGYKDESFRSPSSVRKPTAVCTATYDSSDDNMTRDEPMSENVLSLNSNKNEEDAKKKEIILRGVTYTIKTNNNRESLESMPTPHSCATKQYVVRGDEDSLSSNENDFET